MELYRRGAALASGEIARWSLSGAGAGLTPQPRGRSSSRSGTPRLGLEAPISGGQRGVSRHGEALPHRCRRCPPLRHPAPLSPPAPPWGLRWGLWSVWPFLHILGGRRGKSRARGGAGAARGCGQHPVILARGPALSCVAVSPPFFGRFQLCFFNEKFPPSDS